MMEQASAKKSSIRGDEQGGNYFDNVKKLDDMENKSNRQPYNNLQFVNSMGESEGNQIITERLSKREDGDDEVSEIIKEPKKRINIKRKIIGHYFLEKSIGEGTFGKVKLGTHTLTGEKVAIKILEKDRITDVSDVERVAREIHILKLIRHPNII